jgi:hypothetical protein
VEGGDVSPDDASSGPGSFSITRAPDSYLTITRPTWPQNIVFFGKVTLSMTEDGVCDVTIADDMQMTEAARLFWDGVKSIAPAFGKVPPTA